MNQSVADLADALRHAAGEAGGTQEVLARRFASTVELRHSPPRPTDGPLPGSFLAEATRREIDAVNRALTDRADSNTEVSVEGDRIHFSGRTRGTLRDGTVIDVQTSGWLSVADGVIVALEGNMDTESMETWGRVLADGGFELPDSLSF
jgi:hypothetical protein